MNFIWRIAYNKEEKMSEVLQRLCAKYDAQPISITHADDEVVVLATTNKRF